MLLDSIPSNWLGARPCLLEKRPGLVVEAVFSGLTPSPPGHYLDGAWLGWPDWQPPLPQPQELQLEPQELQPQELQQQESQQR
jgi:hypothetical protein